MLLRAIVDGLKFYYQDNDVFVGQRVALGKYERYETELMLRQIKNGDVVVDVGANIGYYTLLMAKKVGKSGKVYAIEPEKNNFEILKKNVEENGFKNVVMVNAGAGEIDETRELEVSEENLGDHRIRSQMSDLGCQVIRNKKQKIEKIQIIKLDDLVKERVDLMKIDTQGWEPFVIEGAKEIIEKDRPEIFLEYMPEAMTDSGGDGKKMMEYLRYIYKNSWIVDDYLFACYLGKLPIDNYCNNKKGYVDVWMSNKVGLKIYLEQFKNIRIKKLMRKMLGLAETG
jgi:FkbM family methyltransferase